jgi:hypothetical protein
MVERKLVVGKLVDRFVWGSGNVSNFAKGELSQSNLGSRFEMQFDLRRWDVFCSNQKDLWSM